MATKPIQTPLSADLPTDWAMNQIVSPNGTEVGLSEQHGYNYLSAAVNAAQTAVNTINDAFVNLSDQQDLSEVMSGANTYVVSAVTEVDGAENQYDFTISNYTAGEPAMLIFKAPVPAGGSFLFTVNGEHPGEDPAKWYQAAFSDLTTDVIGLWAGGAFVPLIISDVVGENGNTLAFVPAGGVRATLIPPAQSGTLTYNGSVQSPTWSGYDSTKMTMGGVTSGTNAGSYTATFTPKSNYAWTDGTTSAKEVTWTIGRAGVVLPAQSGSLTFNGQPQSPTWTTYDPDAMTMGGTTSATNAGNYSAIFTPNSNYAWMDGTFTEKSVLWTIGKAAGSLSLNIESLSLNYLNPTGTVAVTRAGGGAISAVSNAPGVASAAVSGTNVVVTALATGSAIVTVSVAETVNYTAPVPKTIQVTAQMVDPIFGNGGDGVLHVTAGQTETLPVAVPYQTIVEKNYESITIDAGGVLTCAANNAGLILRCRGNCVINGTIDQARKSPMPNPNNTYQYPAELACGAGGAGGRGSNVGGDGGTGGAGMAAMKYGGGWSGGAGGGPDEDGDDGANGGAVSGITVATPSNTLFQGGTGGTDGRNPTAGVNGGGGGGGSATYSSHDGGYGGSGAGGRGGGGDSDGGGGGGGAGNYGGGVLLLYVNGTVTINGAIDCSGGTGGAGGTGGSVGNSTRIGNGGGGGGAGGGAIYIMHAGSYQNLGLLNVNGGSGGAPGSGGSYAATAGVAGGLGSITVKQYAGG